MNLTFEQRIDRLNKIIKALDKDRTEDRKVIEDTMTIVNAGHRSGQIPVEIWNLLEPIFERYIVRNEEKSSVTRKRRAKVRSCEVGSK